MHDPLITSIRYRYIVRVAAIVVLLLIVGAGCAKNASSDVFESAATAIETGDSDALRTVLDQRVNASDAEMMTALDDEARSALSQAFRNAIFVQDTETYSEYVIHVDDGTRPPTDISVYLVAVDGETKLRFAP